MTEAPAATAFVPARERLRRHLFGVAKAIFWLIVAPGVVFFLVLQGARYLDRRWALRRAEITDRFAEARSHAVVDRSISDVQVQERLDALGKQEAAELYGGDNSTLWPLVLILGFSGCIFAGIGCVILAFAATTFLYRRATRARLHGLLLGRGYEWATEDDAEWLLLRMPRAAWSLPRAEDACVLPGIASSIDGLVAYVELREQLEYERWTEAQRSTPE